MEKRKELTSRECEILYYLAKGYNNKGIADALCISVHTVKSHLENIYAKLYSKNKINAVLMAMKMGYLDINNI